MSVLQAKSFMHAMPVVHDRFRRCPEFARNACQARSTSGASASVFKDHNHTANTAQFFDRCSTSSLCRAAKRRGDTGIYSEPPYARGRSGDNGGVPSYTELQLADGTPVRFEVSLGGGSRDATEPPGARAPLPTGMGDTVPVSRGRAAARGLAVESLRTALRPLGPLLQEVHDAVTGAPTPPHEVNVTFGVELGQDLKLGIVSATGKAHLTVSATWQPGAGEAPAAASGTAPGDRGRGGGAAAAAPAAPAEG